MFTLETDIQRWSDAQDKIGATLVVLGLSRQSAVDIAEGRTVLVGVRDALKAAGHDQFDDHFRERIALADQALASLPDEPSPGPAPPAE